MNRIAAATLAMVLFIFVGGTASAQQVRNLSPRADSPTAMHRCGADLETVKQEKNFVRRYVFSGTERLRNMHYCVSEVKGAVVDTRNTYLVPAGGVGWINSGGTSGILEGCLNDFEFSPPVGPEVPPSPLPPPVEVPKPVLPPAPVCSITGDCWSITGCTGTPVNGDGRWFLDGVEREAGNIFTPPTLLRVGSHIAEYKVVGPGGQMVCPQYKDIFPPLISTAPPPSTKELPPEIKKRGPCGPLKFYCWGPPVATAVVICATRGRGEKKPTPVGMKPPAGVISPARVGFSLRF